MAIKLTGFDFEPVAAEMRISAASDAPYAHVNLDTGACHVQAYAKPDELRELAAAALAAADALESRQAEAVAA